MNLKWSRGTGPTTTQELADAIEKEGRLGIGIYCDPQGLRCLWGVINDWAFTVEDGYVHSRQLSLRNVRTLCEWGLSTSGNDCQSGTPEERCAWAVQRLRSIP